MKLGMTLPIGVGALGDGKPVPWTVLREIAKRGEEVGFDSVMLPDHLLFRRSPPGNNPMVDMPEGKSRGIWEAWSILSAVAEATRMASGLARPCRERRCKRRWRELEEQSNEHPHE